MAQKPKLSVIVPVYNVADYLDWCLDSLAEQTCADLEILCVNDGSTDNSRKILERRQEQDPRIVIIDKENGGLSSARNAGIKAAKAPAVCFLDSDDRFMPDAAEVIVRTFANEQPDVVTIAIHERRHTLGLRSICHCAMWCMSRFILIFCLKKCRARLLGAPRYGLIFCVITTFILMNQLRLEKIRYFILRFIRALIKPCLSQISCMSIGSRVRAL